MPTHPQHVLRFIPHVAFNHCWPVMLIKIHTARCLSFWFSCVKAVLPRKLLFIVYRKAESLATDMQQSCQGEGLATKVQTLWKHTFYWITISKSLTRWWYNSLISFFLQKMWDVDFGRIAASVSNLYHLLHFCTQPVFLDKIIPTP